MAARNMAQVKQRGGGGKEIPSPPPPPPPSFIFWFSFNLISRAIKTEKPGAPNEDIVQNHNIALLNVF